MWLAATGAGKIRRHSFGSGVNDPARGRGEAVIKRPERRADAQCHDFKMGSRGVMQAEYFQRFFECLGGIAGMHGDECLFAERTFGKAGIDSYGAC